MREIQWYKPWLFGHLALMLIRRLQLYQPLCREWEWQEGVRGTGQTVASILRSRSSCVPCPWFRQQVKEAAPDQIVQATCHGRENISVWDTMVVKAHSCWSLLPSSRWQWPLTYSWEVILTYAVFWNHLMALPVEKKNNSHKEEIGFCLGTGVT